LKSFSKIFTFIFLLFVMSLKAEGQSIKLLGADLFNGALTGLTIGGATMALQDSDNRAALRVGLGMGILYGIGTGVYDNSIIGKGEQFYISGTFNDGRNSTIIVLLDTFYGAVGGAAVGSAISLIGNESIVEGLQYGGGAGAWIGFGYGLIDSFVLARGPNDLQASAVPEIRNSARGIVQFKPAADKEVSVGLLNPSVISQKIADSNTLKIKHSMGLEVVNVRVGL
jgi:hypothetical protein